MYVIGKTVFFPDWPPGFATIAILLFFILGINSILMGVIGEYLGRIFQQLKTPILTIIESSLDGSADGDRRVEVVPRKTERIAGDAPHFS
jgi:dolichol-phosphate mannosyltransferase